MRAVKWIYVLDGDERLESGRTFERDYAFIDSTGTCRLEISRQGLLTVKAGYAWDGCTPKFTLLDIVIGTPDGIPNERTLKPKTYYASLFHDVLYQFMADGSPITRQEADTIFLRLMTRDHFRLRGLYYLAVRLFGDLSRRITRRKRKWRGTMRP